ncbi:MAG: redox-regulated ATPase YchF [Nanobdellota archaeon]
MLIGIVGKPSCGKSTLFKASSLADVDVANYPFTTIKPNHAIGFVKTEDPSEEFGVEPTPRTGFMKGNYRFVPVDLIDVAGLVPDAHKGEGMGSQFLNDLNQADVLVHVIDVSGSTNEKGEPVKRLSYDPANDVRFLEKELDHWYLDILKRGWEKFAKQVQQEEGDIRKALAKQLSGLGVDLDMVDKATENLNIEKPLEWTEEQLFSIASYLRKKSKPMIIAANKADVPGAYENFERLKEEFKDYIFVPCSAESELALKEADKAGIIDYIPGSDDFSIQSENISGNQKKALDFIRDKVLSKLGSTGIQEVLDKAVFELLDHIAIYPGGVNKLEDSEGRVLPDCFLLPNGSTTLDFAYYLHTDFGKKFIRAVDVKKRMTVGKDHKLKNGDVIEIIADK